MKNNSQLSTLNACASERNARSLAIFQRAQPSINVVNSQLDIINDYIDRGLLALDPAKPLAVIDWRLHLAVMDDEYPASRPLWRWLIRHGWVERDRQYRRLMKAIKIYLELPRGTMQGQYEERLVTQGMDRAEAHREAVLKYSIHEGPLHFIVTDPEDPSQPLLLGTYDHDKIALVETPSNSPSMGRTQPSSQTNILTEDNE